MFLRIDLPVLDAVMQYGCTPLHIAVSFNCTDIVDIILRYSSVDVNSRDRVRVRLVIWSTLFEAPCLSLFFS